MRVFHPDVYRPDIAVPSYWHATTAAQPAPRLETEIKTEVAVIGGGYTGLSTSLHLARDHRIESVTLDAAPIGWGASGRNGGFVSVGANKLSIAAMIKRWGEMETRRFYSAQMEAVELVRGLLLGEKIDADPQGNASYDVAHHPSATADLMDLGETYRRLFGFNATYLPAEAFRREGHGGREQFGALRLEGPFALHPLKFLSGLREASAYHGARIFGQTPILRWERTASGKHRLITPGGTVTAKVVVLATNGYTPDDLLPAFANRTMPALSNILVTRPLTEEELAAESWRTHAPVANLRDLLFYYRLLPDRRFLFGARGGTCGSASENARMRAWVRLRLGAVFPAWAAVEAEYFWNGLVCLTGRYTPAVGRLQEDPSILYGFGYHGNGVNTAIYAGRQMARAIAAGDLAMPDVPAPMRGLPPHLLHPLVRRWGLKAAYLWHGLKSWSGERL